MLRALDPDADESDADRLDRPRGPRRRLARRPIPRPSAPRRPSPPRPRGRRRASGSLSCRSSCPWRCVPGSRKMGPRGSFYQTISGDRTTAMGRSPRRQSSRRCIPGRGSPTIIEPANVPDPVGICLPVRWCKSRPRGFRVREVPDSNTTTRRPAAPTIARGRPTWRAWAGQPAGGSGRCAGCSASGRSADCRTVNSSTPSSRGAATTPRRRSKS